MILGILGLLMIGGACKGWVDNYYNRLVPIDTPISSRR